MFHWYAIGDWVRIGPALKVRLPFFGPQQEATWQSDIGNRIEAAHIGERGPT